VRNPLLLAGQKFGRLTVLERAVNKAGRACWRCHCDCGQESLVYSQALMNGKTQSCGCLNRELKSRKGPLAANYRHGGAPAGKPTHEYRVWVDAKRRCSGSHPNDRKNYSERGITMCVRWRDSFEAFLADMGPCPPGLTLDRKDNDGDYEPGNCRWADKITQANNTRQNRRFTFDGWTRTIAEWARAKGLPMRTLWARINSGWTIERALTAPVRHWPNGSYFGIPEARP
jgi:hypothetical protein